MNRKRPESWQGRPVLTREAIGRGVLELIAAKGAESFSTRGLARHLGVSTRALYNYVSGREDAISAAATLAQGDLEIPPLAPDDWQQGIRGLCAAYRAWYARYPGLLRLAGSAPATAHPGMLAVNEHVLGFLRAVGLGDEEAAGAWTVLLTTLAGFAEIDAWFARVGDAGRRPAGSAAAQELDEDAFWNTLAVRRSGADVGADATFARTVEMLLCWIGSLRTH